MAGFTFSEREMTALRGVLDSCRAVDPGPVLPWDLLESLRELVSCDSVELNRTSPTTRALLDMQSLGDVRSYVAQEPADLHFWDLYWTSEACSYADSTGDITSVTKVSDFMSDRQWRASPMYHDYARDYGQFRELGTHLPDAPGHTLSLLFWRGPGRDFDERERFMLTLLRPHLVDCYRNAQRTRRRPGRLTARQLEILEYVGSGLTNVQVARRLQISEGTIRTHLNNIYERLGVTSRTAAVSRAFDASR